jgi:hypothetical protein
MWLLDATTHRLSEFHDSANIPPYAILSHKWGEQEVSFTELNEPGLDRKPGYSKIKDFADCAKANGIEWVWVDT